MSMRQPGITNFAGQRVWVIGATSGIGEACAKALITAGAKVAVSGRRLDRLIALCSLGQVDQCLSLPLDVTATEQIDQAYQDIVRHWHGLDLLLFVSGIYIPLRADNFTFELAEQTINANVLGPMHAVAVVLPEMLHQQAGHIAIVGSVAGYSGLPKALAYGPSKAAMINFCEALFYDVQPRG